VIRPTGRPFSAEARRTSSGLRLLIGALDDHDPHHREARTLFRTWRRQDATRLVSVVNLTEVLVAPK